VTGRHCGDCAHADDDPTSGCTLCSAAQVVMPYDPLVPPIRILDGGTITAAPPAVVGPAEMQIETIRTEGGDITLVATIAGRSLRLRTREHGTGAYSGGDSAGVYISGPVDPTLALAIRWLVTGQGPT